MNKMVYPLLCLLIAVLVADCTQSRQDIQWLKDVVQKVQKNITRIRGVEVE